eukprot:5828789-Karenia_brevis.AAC.1
MNLPPKLRPHKPRMKEDLPLPLPVAARSLREELPLESTTLQQRARTTSPFAVPPRASATPPTQGRTLA